MYKLVVVVGALVAIAGPVSADAPGKSPTGDDRIAARTAVEQLVKEARATGDDAKFVACGQAFLDFYNKDPQAAGSDEVLYNASVCFEEGKSIGPAIQANELLLRSSPRSKLVPRATMRIARTYTAIAFYDRAADKLEQYASKFLGEKDAFDALADAIAFRAGLGDVAKQTADVDLLVRAFAVKRPKEVAALRYTLVADEHDPDRAIAFLRDYLKTFGGKLDDEPRMVAQGHLADLLWTKSCPIRALDGLCAKYVLDRKAARCGSDPVARLTVTKRGDKREALELYRAVIGRYQQGVPASTTPIARHVAGMAMLAVADDDFERLLETTLPVEPTVKQLTDWQHAQAKADAEVSQRYTDVLAVKDVVAMVAVAARIGQVAEAGWRALAVADIPKPLRTGTDAKAYCAQNHTLADPLAARAVTTFDACVQQAANLGVGNGWSSLCEREAQGLAAEQHGPRELHADPAELVMAIELAPAMANKRGDSRELAAALARFATNDKAGWTPKECKQSTDELAALARKAPEVQYMVGLAAHRCGNVDAARAAYEKLPDHPAAMVNLGELEWRAGHRDAARKLWSDALKKNGKLFAGQLDSAIAMYTELHALPARDTHRASLEGEIKLAASSALGIRSDPAPLVLLAAVALKDLRNVALARLLLDRATALDDQRAATHLARGVMAARRGDWTSSLLELDTAATLDPASETAQLEAGLAALRVGRFDDAAKRLGAVKTASYDLHVARGVAARGTGRLDDARRHFEVAEKLDPGRAEAAYDLGVLDGTYAATATDPSVLKATLQRAAAAFRRAAAIDAKLDAGALAIAIDKRIATLP